MDTYRRAATRPTHALAVPLLAAVLLLSLLAACQRQVSVESGPAVGGQTVDILLDEYSIDMPMTVRAGQVTFRVRNGGSEIHNFEIEGNGLERSFPSDLRPGEVRTLTVDLEPGTYDVYCPVADHARRGMSRQLTVTSG